MAKEPTTLDEAIEYYSKSNDDLRLATVAFFEKVALYSGAIISLSITFLGYLLSRDPTVFISPFLGRPLYLLIFIAWGCLTYSLFLGIYMRLFSAQHLSRLMHLAWLRLYIKSKKDALEMIETGVARWDREMSSDEEATTLANAKQGVSAHDAFEEEAKGALARYDFLNPFLRRSAVIFFCAGCLLTLLFVALTMLTLARTPVA